MQILVVSDFHLGKGRFLKNGQLNILEDFYEDERFIEFLNYHSTGTNYLSNIHLVLNGDILNLIQVDVDGVFGHVIDSNVTIEALKKVIYGHSEFFEGLKSFLSRPNKSITYVIGNHDSGMAFEGAQKHLKSVVGEKINFSMDFSYGDIHIEHGHRFDAINSVEQKKYFMEGPSGRKILNLPWGSLFCISLLPILKKERPFIDKVRPMSTYFKWCFFHDPRFFLKLLKMLLGYFIATNFSSYIKQNRNFKTTYNVLKQIAIYPQYAKKVKTILSKDESKGIVVMGHTHGLEWRKYPKDKYYLNSGTWNTIPSIDAGMHASVTKLTYILLDVHPKTGKLKDGGLREWKGKWRPFRDEVSIGGAV